MEEIGREFDEIDSNKCRLSLYYVNENEKEPSFVLCGRASDHPEYQKPGRPSYPITEGCLAKCWMEGTHYETGLPDSRGEWVNTQKNSYGINKDVARKLRMHSTTYAGVRIRNSNTRVCNNVAVILFESVDSFDRSPAIQEHLLRELEEQIDYISQLVTALGEFIPTPNYAKESGF